MGGFGLLWRAMRATLAVMLSRVSWWVQARRRSGREQSCWLRVFVWRTCRNNEFKSQIRVSRKGKIFSRSSWKHLWQINLHFVFNVVVKNVHIIFRKCNDSKNVIHTWSYKHFPCAFNVCECTRLNQMLQIKTFIYLFI